MPFKLYFMFLVSQFQLIIYLVKGTFVDYVCNIMSQLLYLGCDTAKVYSTCS